MELVRMVITDLTRMQHGHVCIAGYDRQRNCVRPILPPPGIDETSLIDSASKAIHSSGRSTSSDDRE